MEDNDRSSDGGTVPVWAKPVPGPSSSLQEFGDGSIRCSDVAHFLLDKKFHLSSLEFFQELLNDEYVNDPDVERAVGVLEEFFLNLEVQDAENPGFTPQLEVLRDRDEQVSLLKHELRVARDDVERAKKRSESLAHLAGGDSAAPTYSSHRISVADRDSLAEMVPDSPLTDHEVMMLNSVVDSFLQSRRYSLTSLAFAEEVGGEVEPFEFDLGTLFRAFWLSSQILKDEKERREAEEKKKLEEAAEEESKKGIELVDVNQLRLAQQEANVLRGELEKQQSLALEAEKRSTALQAQIRKLEVQLQEARDGHDNFQKNEKEDGSEESRKEEKNKGSEKTQEEEKEEVVGSDGSGSGKKDEKRDEALVLATPQRKNDQATVERPAVMPLPDWLTRYDGQLASRVSWISAVEDQSNDSCILIVAECLPHIIPNVLLAQRAELIPLILLCVRNHPSAEVREKLTHSLFNLWKIPTAEFREVIIEGCVHLARSIGFERTEVELLPQCWEQISHKYAERRILVAKAVSALAIYVRVDLRSSLLLSVLTQLLDDVTADVRTATAHSLTGLITTMRDDDKYEEVQSIVLKNYLSPYVEVSAEAKDSIVGPLSFWAERKGVVCTLLIHSLLEILEKEIDQADVLARPYREIVSILHVLLPAAFRCVVSTAPFSDQIDRSFFAPRISSVQVPPGGDPGKNAKRGMYQRLSSEIEKELDLEETKESDGDNALPDVGARPKKVKVTLEEERAELERMEAKRGARNSVPESHPPRARTVVRDESDRKVSDLASIKQVQGFLDAFFEREEESWSGLDWLACEFVPRLVRMSYSTESVSFNKLFGALCTLFGKGFSTAVVQPVFTNLLDDEKEVSRRRSLLPLFLGPVLGAIGPDHVVIQLRALLLALAEETCGYSSDSLPDVVRGIQLLCSMHELGGSVLDVLWELVIHPKAAVRLVVVKLLDAMLTLTPPLESSLVADRLFPGVVTLSTDLDPAVRLASIRAFGTTIGNVVDEAVLEKAGACLDNFLEPGDSDVVFIVVRCFAQAIPTADANFRDRYILNRLLALSRDPATPDIAHSLLAAFTAFHGARIKESTIRDGIIPGFVMLRDYHKDDEGQRNQIDQLIRETEGALPSYDPKKSGGRMFRKSKKGTASASSVRKERDRK